jgi:hypothetical protein
MLHYRTNVNELPDYILGKLCLELDIKIHKTMKKIVVMNIEK